MADIFISYARADRNAVEKLAAALEAEGYDVWWDRQIVGGAEFSKDIERELNAANVVIVAWSKQAIDSRWVKDEAVAGADAGKLIPVSVDGTQAPMGFRQFHLIDLSDWHNNSDSTSFQDLSRAVKANLTGEVHIAPVVASSSLADKLLKPIPIVTAGVAAIGLVAGALMLQNNGSSPSLETDASQSNQAEGAGSETAILANTNAQGAAPINESASQASTVSDSSIAVLAFADLSQAGDQEYFSDGIAEEILNVLVGVEGLKVASRTSSFQFKGQEAIGIPVIAEELRVRHVLEGSVRKAGDTVRITAQLIDAQTDQHLWSQTYDRPLSVENLFAVQDEIAQEIVKALGGKLQIGDGAQKGIVTADTGNLGAYELYLEAHSRFMERGNSDFFRVTIGMFEKVVELDPDFARGWAGLAGAASIAGGRGLSDRDFSALTHMAATRALELNPKMSLAYAALARLEERKSPPDFKAALALYGKAINAEPRDPNAYHWRSMLMQRMGYFERAIQDAEHCLELDPNYLNCRGSLSFIAFLRGDSATGLKLKREINVKGAHFFDFDYLSHLAKVDLHNALIGNITGLILFGDGERWMIEPIYRAMTDPTYNREEGYRRFNARVDASGLSLAPENTILLLSVFAFAAYEDLIPIEGEIFWASSVPEFVVSPHRKRLFREAGLPAYWREHGFPPQCRPVGADDFECD